MDNINIVICTGAGISAESGIPTFRDQDGLWSKYDVNEVAHIKGWLAQPQKVLDFKNELRREFLAADYQPNAAHHALTRLQKQWKYGEVTIVTQNIDGLHVKAGSKVHEIHGSALEKFCEKCGHKSPYDADIVLDDGCINCGIPATTRPFTVLFGEMPIGLETIEAKLDDCDIYATIGSSCEVMPASLFPSLALANNAQTFLINKEPVRASTEEFGEVIYGLASIEVPKWVDRLLRQYALRHAQ